jgi:hypothetical protein
MKQLLFILIILVVIVYFQYLAINSGGTSDFTILQYQNPNKDMIEKILFEKRITIFTDLDLGGIMYNKMPVFMIKPSIYSKLNQTQHNTILKELKSYFGYYYLPMTVKSDISINYEKNTTKTTLKEQLNYRFCICQFLGARKLYLFPPEAKQDLYYDTHTNKYNVNFWNQDTAKFPRVKNAKYVEILLHQGQAIFIPYRWTYCYEIIENGMSVSFYSESLFSNMLKK